jgi:hypothetical protein
LSWDATIIGFDYQNVQNFWAINAREDKRFGATAFGAPADDHTLLIDFIENVEIFGLLVFVRAGFFLAQIHSKARGYGIKKQS